MLILRLRSAGLRIAGGYFNESMGTLALTFSFRRWASGIYLHKNSVKADFLSYSSHIAAKTLQPAKGELGKENK